MPLGALAACSRQPRHAASPLVPQLSGTLAVAGLESPVRVVRDTAGVPHIYAASQRDLFFAQGFVQAQDRLFQMDLWRRASLGRLSEVLGANFVDRDAMTRRVQYRGDLAREWESYGPDAKRIADAFVRGVNAWVSIVREHPTEDFVLAGWPPAYWSADDLINRTDAFLESGGALDEVRRRGLPDAVRDALRLVGTPPFLVGQVPPDAWTGVGSTPHAAIDGGSIVSTDARRTLAAPSPRYLVHLVAPGWNVVGATAPWLPGVVMGHNDRVAWGVEPIADASQDIRIEDASVVSTGPQELVRVKGRATMVPFTRDAAPDGVAIASDREHHRAYVLHWTGFEPGAAAELGAIAIDRVRAAHEVREALTHWRLPARRVVYADLDGRSGEIDVPSPVRGRARPRNDSARAFQASVSDRAVFVHVLGVRDARRFDVGPIPRPADDSFLQLQIDVRTWDRSRAINAPGQSGLPSSAHYADAARRWASGETVELWFTEEAVRQHTAATLTLVPKE